MSYPRTQRSNSGKAQTHNPLIFCFVWFDSLGPFNNLSVIKGQVFLGWTSTKLGLMFLLKDTKQWCRRGSNPGSLGLESSTLPLNHRLQQPLNLESSTLPLSHLAPHVINYTTEPLQFPSNSLYLIVVCSHLLINLGSQYCKQYKPKIAEGQGLR